MFAEHGLAPDPDVVKWQNRINPMWGKIAGGCNLNRNIPAILEESGFKVETLDQQYLPGTPRFAGYNYWGGARAV